MSGFDSVDKRLIALIQQRSRIRGTGLTIGRHPVAFQRTELNKLGACRAIDMQQLRDGSAISVAGWVITRNGPAPPRALCF